MKHCPLCQSVYPVDDVFCPNDGSALVEQEPQGQSRVVVSWDDKPEIPTQYVSIPQQTPSPIPPPNNPGWLYALVGVLIAVIVMGMGFFVFVGSRNDDGEMVNVNRSNTVTSAYNGVPYTGMQGAANRMANAANAARTPANAMAMAPPANAPASNIARPGAPIERRFSSTFAGTVDNDGIEMYLTRNGSQLSGTVRPYGRRADIYVEGYIENDGSFAMDEKSDIGVVTGVYRGRFNSDGTVNGVWSKPSGDKTRPLFLRRQ